jgi:peptidoglycan/LPS O-acetylase OafA/YrhL
MAKSLWSKFIARLLVRIALAGVAGLIALVPGAEGQSVAAMAVFMALALFVVIHSHRERQRRRATR